MSMFCFQCEQTAKGQGCTVCGVCGKKEDTAHLQDDVISSLIEIASVNKPNDETTKFIIDGLFTTITNANFDNDALKTMIKNPKYDMNNIWGANEDIRSLKSLILFGIKGMAAYAHHAWALGYKNEEVNNFFYEALSSLSKDLSADDLLKLVLKTGEVNLKCMEMLDKANTESYGNPEPTQVTKNIEKGPFIIVTGHDLHDLKMLLEQTKDKGVNIYTHGEMLPAHAYPELKKYPQLKGNFGTAWQNQQKEFDNVPAAILYTTNCLMPVKPSYKDRVFTTAVVHYPECSYIKEDENGNKDFSPVINKALELGGYSEDKKMPGINGGETLTVGFGHHTVLGVADKVIDAVKSGALKHIFLVGGCDGAKPGRNYYTEFVKQTPADALVLTCACGKYRFNDMDLGNIGGIPRLLDMGQCNDAYSAIKVAVELSKAFNCTVNELPLSIVLSWYEQKAVCILLTLLYLGIKNIKLGPSLPAFVSPNVLDILVKNFNIAPTTTPEQDLKEILG
ncbi:MAG: hydroxylamine reductase [Cyanobacteriota bacterium]|nr:hydroxylamine reductase [Cyanobacteriota bacterium]MDY6358761.1 hydroxylamine reductase [Cyanobacteriota bacterium]MDY6383766.1 hydroxylamine reductase [Cyanobacteriota bacterium]